MKAPDDICTTSIGEWEEEESDFDTAMCKDALKTANEILPSRCSGPIRGALHKV
jgi:hypothetical protein